MSRLIREFSTPIFFSKWDLASIYCETILSAIIGETDQNTRLLEKRGQEVTYCQTTLETHSIYSVPVELLRSGKTETNDQLHCSGNSLEPLYKWVLERFEQLLDRLAPEARKSVVPRVANSWGSVYREGDYHDYHNHPNAAFVGVYCVRSPNQPAPQGALNLQDPRGSINYYNPLLPLFAGDSRSVMLLEGDLVIFPGWLRHSVSPFRGPGERVTISINFGYDLQHMSI